MPEVQISILEQAKGETIGTAKEGNGMKTAIYCRVSTDGQEVEGTSLTTQLQGCLDYCADKGYPVAYRFSETYSGLAIERPKLIELRDLVTNDAVDIVLCHSLDRLFRDPVHGVLLLDEFERHGVKLEAVTEAIDGSEVGKLITYVRGFAAKLEAQKIKERTVRGRRARAMDGRVSGGFHITFGYNYLPVSEKGGGRRVVNETEAPWVQQMYQWASEGFTTGAIQQRLMANGAPTKSGRPWCKGSVIAILKNPAYCGKTYAFSSIKKKPRTKPESEWIELPGITPAIISGELFEAVQKQLRANRERARRNTKHEYLLRSHVRCAQCGYTYSGGISTTGRKDGERYRRIYRCCGKWKENAARRGECHNKSWRADVLEAAVWSKLQAYLNTPDMINSQIARQRQEASQLDTFKAELQQIDRQLKSLAREQKELLSNALRGFPEDLIVSENRKINGKREAVKARKVELAALIKASQDATVNLPKLEQFVERVKGRMAGLDFEGKREVLDMLSITVWLNGTHVHLTGTIDPRDVTVTTSLTGRLPAWPYELQSLHLNACPQYSVVP